MTEENMKLWDAVKQPPPTALKVIMGGRLKGKSDISPQWRYQAMTEQFGPCGVGWKYEIKRLWNEPGPANQVFAFAEIMLYIKTDQWSEPIPGVGGSMLVEQESSGLHASDEGYKMAITDALSVSMKMIGVAADVYAGLWDGSKYRDNPSVAPDSTTQTAKEHWCEEHKTEFFKRGKMREFAHPVDGQAQWCAEKKQLEGVMQEEAPQKAPKGTFTEEVARVEEAPARSGMGVDQFWKIIEKGFKLGHEEALAWLEIESLSDWSEPLETALDRLADITGKKWRAGK